jgi:hypothetical protein
MGDDLRLRRGKGSGNESPRRYTELISFQERSGMADDQGLAKI